MRWLRRLLLLSLLALAGGAAAYVQSEGFSQKWRTFVIEQFEKRGIYLTLDRLTLNPMEGLVARNIHVFLDKKRTVMLADVDRLNLDLDYNKMLRREVFLEGADLRNADLSFPIDPENPASEKLSLQDFSARIFLVGDRIEVSKAEGTLYGLQIHLTGSVLRPEPEPEDERVIEERRRRRMAAIKAQRSLIIEAAKALRHFESAEAPRLDIQVNGDLEKPEEMSGSLHLSARNLRHGTYECEEIEAVASYAGAQVDLSRLRVKDHLGELEASAVWQLGGEAVDFHLRSTADLPGLAAAVFQNEGLREVVFYDPPELVADGKLLLGKARPADAFVPVECVGAVSARRFVTRGEIMDGLEASFGLSPQGCYFRDVLLRHKTGTLSVQAMWQKEVGLKYKALVQLDPHIFMPFIEAKPVKEIVNRFAFTSDSGIYAEVEGEGDDLKMKTCQNHGRVELHNFSYRGAAMKRASADVEFSGFKHAYRNVDLEREEGRASAKEVACDDEAHTVRLTGAVSDCDPVVLTNCFAPKTAENIARYRFDKHPHAELDGIIGLVKGTDLHVKFRSAGTAHYVLWGDDYTIHEPVGDLQFAGADLTYDVTGDVFGEPMACKGKANLRMEANDYTVDFHAGRFPYDVFGRPVPFSKVRTNVTCKAGQVDFEAQADMLDGRCRIKGRVDDTRKPQRYSGEIRLDAVSFNKFARIYSPKDETEGDLTGIFNFTGNMGDWRSLAGKGTLTILNGNLYAVPILGPLTPLLGALLPRPIKGYNVAKEADCTFQVADGFATTEDIEALTTVFRLVSKGKVDFLEDRIQFEAQAKFRGLPGLVLFPVSEILEYVGEGTVGTPLWRPRYFSGSKEKTEFRKLGEKPETAPENTPRPKETPPVRPNLMKK
jgi:hypothetical protein